MQGKEVVSDCLGVGKGGLFRQGAWGSLLEEGRLS